MKEYARLSNVPLYINIALDNYKKAVESQAEITRIECDSEVDEVEKIYLLNNTSEESHKSSVTTVVFISMAIEAYIYDYSARELSDNFAKTYLDKVDILSKWVLIPKLVKGKDFPIERQGFQLLKELFGYRNKLVHFKSSNITSDNLADIHGRLVDSFEMASKAIQALIEISKDMEMIDSEEPIAFMFNINKCKEILE